MCFTKYLSFCSKLVLVMVFAYICGVFPDVFLRL